MNKIFKKCVNQITVPMHECEQYIEGRTVGSLVMSTESCAVGGIVGGGD